MKAKCLECPWKGEVESPEIHSCPKCGGELFHYIIDSSSEKEVVEDGEKKKAKSQKMG